MTIFPVDYADGSRGYRVQYNRKSLGTFKGKGALGKARAAEAAHIAALGEEPEPDAPPTIAEWQTEWLDGYRSRPDTRRHYEERTRAFVKAHGGERIDRFTARQAKAWHDAHRSSVSVVKTMFNAAYKLDVIEKTPWKNIETPKYVRDIEPGWLTLEEVNQLAATALRARAPQESGEPDPMAVLMSAMVEVAAWTAIRPGELFAIGPGDLDRERFELRIREAVNSKTRLRKAPKNGYARTVVCPQPAIDAIDRSRDAYDFIMAGRPQPVKPTFFVTVTGKQLSVPSWNVSYWSPMRTLFGRPAMEWYELRHFGATVLLDAGASYDDVAHQLGQADADLVRKVYGHPDAVKIRKRIHEAMIRAQTSVQVANGGAASIIQMPTR